MNLVDELHAVARALKVASIPYAVCGGVAVTMHGATRTTKDIDLLVPPEHIAAALEALRPLGYTFVALPMTFEAGTPRERHVQRVTKVEGRQHLIVDLIAERGPFAGLLADRVAVELPEGEVQLVSRATLEAMKRLAGRPQDLADLAKLAEPEEAGDG
ncbi:MAG: nucleotidyltransferase family protein [Deltaproteobacteria bacterium]|nr:nucleotidyltransferase family protein [Deltaproteobacteria bacterium]